MAGEEKRKLYRRFESIEIEIVWAAIECLDIADRHVLLKALGEELFVEPHLRGDGRANREARAVLALREAAELLGRSPSIKEFEDLSRVHSDMRWPPPSRIRAWLGSGSWNAALVRAGLQGCASDAVIRERGGSRFSRETLLDAVRLAAGGLGTTPTFDEYCHWVRRPDVVKEHGLLPRSPNTFIKEFGSWPEALVEAGLRGSGLAVSRDGLLRLARYAYTREEVIGALKEAAEELGHAPVVSEYKRFRARAYARAAAEFVSSAPTSSSSPTETKPMPSVRTIKRMFEDDWSAACLVAGVEPPPPPLRARFSDDELIASLVRAIEEIGGQISASEYDDWRERADSSTVGFLGGRVPSARVIRRRFDSWAKARTLAVDSDDADAA